ncbi:MAG: thiamine pyrophosphate-dependent enzyme, partial [Anaerolineae bacterium]
DFVGAALGLSEEWDTPVIVRTVMRISHSASPVALGEREAADASPTPSFKRDPHRLVCTCVWAKHQHPVIEERLNRLSAFANTYRLNRLEWRDRELGIVAGGAAYSYAREVFPEASFLKLGMSYPLPFDLVRELADGVKQLLVVEELDPFLEEQIKAQGIRCRGKDIFPAYGELTPAVIERHAAQVGLLPEGGVKGTRDLPLPELAGRSPIFCPGCPHRSTFYVLGNKMRKTIVTGGIGCYNLGALPPFDATDTMGAMGASIGVAHGLDIADIPDPFIAVIGDSSFFHAGIPPLLNIVHNGGNSTVVILDNRTTAMTGHQDHPGVAQTLRGKPTRKVEIEDVVRACGVEDIHQVDAFDIEAVEETYKAALAYDGPSVVIVEGPCYFVGPGDLGTYEVDIETCIACGTCFKLGCPAIKRSKEMHAKTGRAKSAIDPVLCVGCDLCAQVCPTGAIHAVDGPVTRGQAS